MEQNSIEHFERNTVIELENIATTVQSLANAMILLSSNVSNDPRLNGAIEEIASIVEGKSENMVRLATKLNLEGQEIFSKPIRSVK